MINANPFLDADFLKELCEQRERTVYARIVALNMQEEPMEEISGRVTQGSINIDGTSSVRRSFSLSMVANDININDYYWGLNTKIKLYIGLKNSINKKYDDIIWFKQGVFILSTFNTSQSVNSYSISVNGKDKMCKLNGELGGMIESLSADFGKLKSYTRDANGKLITTTEDIPIKTIIREAVHKYGNEPFQNIIINDIDEFGLELMEYRGSTEKPLYMLINLYTNEIENITFDGEKEYYNTENGKIVRLKDILHYDPRMSQNFSGTEEKVTEIKVLDGGQVSDEVVYSVAKVSYGEVCGYRLTELTYPGELTAKVGDAITSILDKIKNMLGEFEYFYDIDGHFVFQKKKTYVQTPFNGLIDDGTVDRFVLRKFKNGEGYIPSMYYTKINGGFELARGLWDSTLTYYEKIDGAHTSSAIDTSDITYFFGDSNLVTSFQNTPNLSNLKNDFSIWGAKKSKVSDKTIPIHLRYAIDKKPTQYTTSDGLKMYTTKPYEEVLEELTHKYEMQKTPNANGLPEEWWDVHEWAEVYRIRTGAYPTETIGKYCKPTEVRVFDYFAPGGAYGSNKDYTVNTDDIFYYIDTNQVASIHGICGHTYTYYIQQAQNGIGAYIHDPQIPDKVLDNLDESTLYDGRTEIISGVDWREIIYQMAIDYNAHCHEDDFMVKVYNNNEGLFNEDGTTGYESYYTDMEGFWRDLYNPRPPIAGGADFIRLINEVINALEDYKVGHLTNLQMKELGEEFYKYFKKNVEKDWYEMKTVDDYDSETEYESAQRSFWKTIREKQFPDDGIQTFYTWDKDNEVYVPGKFEDHVVLNPIPTLQQMRTNTRLYQSNGGATYYELKRFDEHHYYDKRKDISTISMMKDKTYYYAKKASDLTLQNYQSKQWSYLSKLDRADYGSDQEYQAAMEIGPNAAFQIGYKYFEYGGYERVNTLKQGVQYYTRTEKAEGQYEYTPAVKLLENVTYYSEDPGITASDIRVQTFTRGHTYYSKVNGQKVVAFTYSQDAVYYENVGFTEVLDLTQCTTSDKFYYLKDAITPDGEAVTSLVALTMHHGNYYLPIDQSIVFYHRVPLEEVKNGKYYPLLPEHGVYVYNNSPEKQVAIDRLKLIYNTPNFTREFEIMKNDTATYGGADICELALLDYQMSIAEEEYLADLKSLQDSYNKELENARKEDRNPRMTDTDLANGIANLIDIRNKRLEYLTSKKYATNFEVVDVIRNFEYNKRYFTRKTIGTNSNGEPEYEYLRFNCYSFKTKDALYDAPTYNINTGWAMDLHNDPANLTFWFDFLDTDGDIFKYSAKTVGNRPKAVNDEKVKAIYYRDTPSVIFVNADKWDEYRDVKPGYTYVKLTYDLENLFTISPQGKTAHSELEEFLYQFTCCTESISMTTVPVYHLEPNTRISVRDDKSHINGDYLISRLTIPLTYNGTMNISATKAVDTIY